MSFRIARALILLAVAVAASCGKDDGDSQPEPASPPVQPPPPPPPPPPPLPGVPTLRASVDSAGAQATGTSTRPSISADGRYVAFHSDATDLVAGDVNAWQDVFVRDTVSNTTTLVSVDTAGTQGNRNSYYASISGDGRYVAFLSEATNLVPGDTNLYRDVFVRDLVLNTTTRASVNSAGEQADQVSYDPSISSNGRHVVFFSSAPNLAPGDTNLTFDIFVRDMVLNTTTRASVDSAGGETVQPSYAGSISSDGRYVAFMSWDDHLTAGDTNFSSDVFLRDMVLDTTTRLSVDSAGAQGNGPSWTPSISSNGRFVAFPSNAANLVPGDTNGLMDIFVRDTVLNTTTRVSVDSSGGEIPGQCQYFSISGDGRHVAFGAGTENVVAGDTNGFEDFYVRDTILNTTTRVSIDSEGAQANGDSWGTVSISSDGRYVAFDSEATNLVAGDTNGFRDVFLHGPRF